MTTYSVVDEFAHGDYPLAADLNKIKDGINHIGEEWEDGTTPSASDELTHRNEAVYQNRENGVGSTGREGSDFTFIHTQRWLHYTSSGAIEDLAGLEDAVSLSNDSTYNFYDLDTVSWLSYGSLYRVTGVDVCFEDYEP